MCVNSGCFKICTCERRPWAMLRYVLGICLLVGGIQQARAEERNASALVIEPDFLGPVGAAQFPTSILLLDTPIAIRYILITVISFWDIDAACEPRKQALNFWGEVDRLSDELCQHPNTFGEMYAYSFLRSIEREYPEPARLYAEVLRNNGYDPEDRSTDKNTAIGFGNAVGVRVAEWFEKDDWNSQGNRRREHFGGAFEDYTGYTPVNSPYKLEYPLRWQPLEISDFRIGRYTHQQHVVPFLGQVRPLVLTQEEADSRKVDLPYMNMNATSLSESDAGVMDKLMKEVFEASKNLTPMQRFLSLWWDNKFVSLGVLAGYYVTELGGAQHENARWLLGELLAQYDALLLAWREKRRIDAVRPRSIARTFYGDQSFDVFVSEEKVVRSVLGKDWEPFVVTQPHSEFPSASASLCTATADHGALLMKELMEAKGISEEPPFKQDINPIAFPFQVPDGVVGDVIEFQTIKDLGRNCGSSRLWAGVHFSPSIPAGEKLAVGIGEKAYWMVKDLSEGRVPKDCWWCTANC